MVKKLAKLFDYQKFEQNEKLSELIKETEERQIKALTEDELGMVNAAGIPAEEDVGRIAVAKAERAGKARLAADEIVVARASIVNKELATRADSGTKADAR